MKDLKKIILLSIIPVLLTIFFLVQFTVPSVKEYFRLKEKINNEKIAINELEKNINILKRNQALLSELNKLNAELTGFDIEFPSNFKDEILLIDLEIFADETVNKIMRVETMPARKVNIIDPEQQEKQDVRRRRTSRNKEEKPQPVTIMEKPIEINSVAYYNEIIDFISFLENYQRKVNIQGIYTDVFNPDKENPNPRIELKIKGSVYKSTVNKIPEPVESPAPSDNTTTVNDQS